ncbi:hypothetical protein Amsp01_102130 [Amycolatopsis sp. NBRC 101858]|nr:hypothetical protein Amsp01_102130 [Amycolatopsis sp. NBRC 101858]
MPTGQAARRQGLDYRRCRRYLTRRGIKVRIARRGLEGESRLGRVRWVVERTISWLLRFKRLGLRYERTTLALLTLACTVINVRRLIKIERGAGPRVGTGPPSPRGRSISRRRLQPRC